MIIKGKKFFAKGKRGFIYTGYLGRKKIVVKEKNPSSFALGRIKNEAEFLKIQEVPRPVAAAFRAK